MSTHQIEVINKLKQNITVDNLEKRTTKKVQAIADALMLEVKQNFGNDLGYYLLSKFENSNQTIEKISQLDPEELSLKNQTVRACDCEADNECTRLTGVSIGPGGLGLNWEYGKCGGTCYVETYFFGLWESSNTGRCSF